MSRSPFTQARFGGETVQGGDEAEKTSAARI
jgi:hypothetical protein